MLKAVAYDGVEPLTGHASRTFASNLRTDTLLCYLSSSVSSFPRPLASACSETSRDGACRRDARSDGILLFLSPRQRVYHRSSVYWTRCCPFESEWVGSCGVVSPSALGQALVC